MHSKNAAASHNPGARWVTLFILTTINLFLAPWVASSWSNDLIRPTRSDFQHIPILSSKFLINLAMAQLIYSTYNSTTGKTVIIWACTFVWEGSWWSILKFADVWCILVHGVLHLTTLSVWTEVKCSHEIQLDPILFFRQWGNAETGFGREEGRK